MSGPRERLTLPPTLALPIIADGALAGRGVAEGRLVPLLIVDTSSRPEIDELVRVHEHLPPGDVKFRWMRAEDDDDEIGLYVTFVQPMDVDVLLRFSIERQAILVEAMMVAEAVWLQPGHAGDRLLSTTDAPRILIGLPETGFRPDWETFLLKRMTRVLARRMGTSRRKAEPAAQKIIENMRELVGFRVK